MKWVLHLGCIEQCLLEILYVYNMLWSKHTDLNIKTKEKLDTTKYCRYVLR